MAMHDFDFQLGKGRQLKGRGWSGLVALALLLAAAVTISATVSPVLFEGARSAIMQLISALKIHL